MRPPNPRRAGLVARTELRRTWRRLRDSTRGIILLLGAGLLVPAYSFGIGSMAYFGGSGVVTGDPERLRLAATGVVAGLLGLVAFIVLQRTIKTNGEPDAADGLLTTATYEDVLAGLLVAECGRLFGVLAVPLLALAVGVTAGIGSPLLGLVVLATTTVVAVLGVVLGYAAGLVAKLIAARSLFVARHRASIGAASSLLFVVVWVGSSGATGVQLALLRAATRSPLSWAGEILLLGVPTASASPFPAAVAGAVLLGALPAGGFACLWLAERVWYLDPVQPDHEFGAAEQSLSDRLLTGRVSTATRVVAQKSWLRAKRAPFTVQFAITPFFFLAFQLQTVLLERTVPPTIPLFAGLASAAAAGAAFTLNPLGGEEQVLPLTLTSNVSGRTFVTGLVLAGALPGVALTTLLVVGFGLAAGLGPATLVTALATALVATLGAPAIAAAAGVVFPKFERASVGSREVVVPSGLAFGLYFVLLGVVVAPGSGAFALAVADTAVPLATPLLLAGGVLVTLLSTAIAASLCFLYAANRIGGYRLE